MTIQQLLHYVRERLSSVNNNELAIVEAETIIEYIFNISKTRLYVDPSIHISSNKLTRVNTIIKRRMQNEPLQYILGKAYFYDREFFVDRNVLIPRPDTETLVEMVIDTEKGETARFIDIGTGSGILAVVLTSLRPGWSALGIDVSLDALRVAARNCDDGVSHRNKNVKLICGDLLTAVNPAQQFDFIVGNPPYISSAQMAELDKSVIDYEPHTALHGGEDGLDHYRTISSRAKNYLKDGGRVYLEIGYDQGESVLGIFADGEWGDAAVIKDLGGRDRVVMCQK